MHNWYAAVVDLQILLSKVFLIILMTVESIRKAQPSHGGVDDTIQIPVTTISPTPSIIAAPNFMALQ